MDDRAFAGGLFEGKERLAGHPAVLDGTVPVALELFGLADNDVGQFLANLVVRGFAPLDGGQIVGEQQRLSRVAHFAVEGDDHR